MAELEPDDDTTWRWVVRHRRYVPERGQFRRVVVAAYDNRVEADAAAEELNRRLRAEIAEGTRDAGERVDQVVWEPGHHEAKARGKDVSAAIRHGADPRALLRQGRVPFSQVVFGVDEQGHRFSVGGGEPPLPIVLIPLDEEIVTSRLAGTTFELARVLAGRNRTVRFGPEFPGDALALYPLTLTHAGADGVVPGTFVVVDLEDGTAVGQVGVVGVEGEPEDGRVEIGYGINLSARGRGVATAAVRQLLARLFAGGTERVTARTAVTNLASAWVLEKCGFVVVGREYSASEGDLLIWSTEPSAS